MTTPANGNSPTAEMKQTLLDLKKTLEGAIESKASADVVTKLQAQVDGIDVKLAHRHAADVPVKSLADTLKENESVSRILRDRKGRAFIDLDAHQVSAIMNRKTIISAITSGSQDSDTLNPVGVATTGVLQIDRIAGITPEARQVLKIRNVLSARPTTMQVVDFVKVTSPLSIASPVAEASIMPENSLTFQSLSEKVRLIATWIPATRQVLEDFTELMGFLQTSIPYYIDLEEELQFLSGDNTGENIHGLLGQAASYNSSLLPSAAKGWTRLDVVATAYEQIDIAKEIAPTFVVLHPSDAWAIRLTKDSFGRYILGDPQAQVRPNIFGLDMVVTTSIAQGTFLVGSGSPVAAEIRDRQGMQLEISTEHSDFFVRSLVAIRAEKRMCLVTKRPNSFVSGSFTQSPA